jgi:hypothetical protein
MNTATETKEAINLTSEFESNICHRCNGAGRIKEYSGVHSGICFLCSGAKKIYTKRGKAALAMYSRSLQKTFSEIEVGDKIYEAGCNFIPSRWLTVTAKNETALTFGNSTWHGRRADELFRVAWSKEAKAEKRRAALEYQATLTKAGTPRKR